MFLSAGWNASGARAAWAIFYSLVTLSVVLALALALEYRLTGGVNMQGVFFSHGLMAELLATLFPLFFCVYLFEKNRRLAVGAALLAMLASLAALSLTLRRGPLLGTVVAFLCIMGSLLFNQMKGAERIRVILVVFLLLVVGLPVIVLKRESIMTRLRGVTELQAAVGTESIELGLTTRAVTWLTAWEMGKGNPIKGVGLGNYPMHYSRYRRSFAENPNNGAVIAAAETEDYDQIRSPFAHSEYLQVFAELGLIGVVLFTLFWLACLRYLWRVRQARRGYLAFGVFNCVIAFGVSAATSSFALRESPGFISLACLLVLGLAAVADSPVEEKNAASVFTLPRNAITGLWIFAALASALLLVRNYNVFAGQRLHGSARLDKQLDFSFALGNDAANEALVARYQKVLDSDSYNAGAHLGLSILLFQMKRLPECLQHADYAFQHGYNRPFTYLLRAFAHEHSAASDKAQEIFSEGIASFPKSVILRTAYAELLRKRGRPEEVQTQQAELERQKLPADFIKSWTLAMRYKDAEATRLAKENGLTPPGELKPILARVLTQARAYHYLRDNVPIAAPTP